MKVSTVLKGLGATVLVGGLVWTGSATLEVASQFITSADNKVFMADKGINLLKADVITKKDRIEELKAQVKGLEEQLVDFNGTKEELEKVKADLVSANAEIEKLANDLAQMTTEKDNLTNELTKANTEAEALQSVLDATISNDIVIPTIGEIENFINESGESEYNPENEKITWNTSSNPTYAEVEGNFITNYNEIINSLLTDAQVSAKGIDITVEATSNTIFRLYVKGASTEAKAILTKANLNTTINNNNYYVDKVIFN